MERKLIDIIALTCTSEKKMHNVSVENLFHNISTFDINNSRHNKPRELRKKMKSNNYTECMFTLSKKRAPQKVVTCTYIAFHSKG